MTELTSRPLQTTDSVARVSGRRLLAALGIGCATSALVGTITHYAVQLAMPAMNSTVSAQLIVIEVYVLLSSAVAFAFRPLHEPPLGLRFTSTRDLALSLVAWLGGIAVSAAAYLFLRPAFGSLTDALRKILTVATDAKRLQGQPIAAWAIAIPRGCLLAPLFEELFFRGALLAWLRGYWSDLLAIVASAALFAGMHVYPIAMPFAFIFGVSTGWIRLRTGSTVNTVVMHALNNVLFLYLGFLLLR